MENICKGIKQAGWYGFIKDIIIPVIVFGFGILIFCKQNKIQKDIYLNNKIESRFPYPNNTIEQRDYIYNMVNFIKYNKDKAEDQIALNLLRIQANNLAEKLKYYSWEESFDPPSYTDGAKGGANDYRYLVRDTFQKILEVDTNIVKSALFNVYSLDNFQENQIANVGVLYVFAKLPRCSLNKNELDKLKKVLDYSDNEIVTKFYNDLWNRLIKKEKL